MAQLQRRQRHWFGRLMSGLAALIGILAVVAGAPLLLIEMAGNPLPEQLPTLAQVGSALTSPDNGTLFLRMLTVVAWLAWATFTFSILIEIPAQLRGRRARRVRGLGVQQRLAAALVGGLIAAFASASVATALPLTAPAAAVAQQHPTAQYGASAVIQADLVRVATVEVQIERPVYVVQRGDYLGRIAQRFTGEFDRYQQICALNPALVRDPDHIEPGWRLVLPTDAYDRGQLSHATGELLVAGSTPATPPPATPAPPPPPPPAQSSPAPVAPSTAAPQPSVQVVTPSSAPASQAPVPSASASPTPAVGTAPVAATPGEAARDDGADHPTDNDANRALAAGAGLAAASVLAAHVIIRRRIRRVHQMRLRRRRTSQIFRPLIPVEEAGPNEIAKHRAGDRLAGGLRRLAIGLRGRAPWEMPDIAAAWQSGGDLAIILATPCPDPPEPFEALWPNTWSLSANERLPESGGAPSLLPGLLKVGTWPQGGELYVDGERTGLLTLTGDPLACDNLLRHLAAEAATAPWADGASVLVAGMSAVDMRALGVLNMGRVRMRASVNDALTRISRRAAANASMLNQSDAVDTVAARVENSMEASWATHLLFVADAWGEHSEQLRELDAQLAGLGRVGVVVVATNPTATRWSASVSDDGGLHMSWLAATDVRACQLANHELAAFAAAVTDVDEAARGPRHRLNP